MKENFMISSWYINFIKLGKHYIMNGKMLYYSFTLKLISLLL